MSTLATPPARPSLARTSSATSQRSTTASLTPSTSRPSYLRSISSTTLNPQRNKPRLYLALYPRGHTSSTFSSNTNCSSYHFALLVGPQSSNRSDPGTRYHVSHTDDSIHPFLYEETDITTSESHIPLVRITIAKVRDPERLIAILRDVPPPRPSANREVSCLSWTQAAFEALVSDRGLDGNPCLSSYLKVGDWEYVEERARTYVKRKRDARRWDREHPGPWDRGLVSTWNYWENRETTV
jgi:hypothetical protein